MLIYNYLLVRLIRAETKFMRTRQESKELREKVYELWDSGNYSKYGIAKLYGITPSWVIQLIKRREKEKEQSI